MKTWKMTYELCCHFGSPVTGHSYSLRCFPREMFHQRVQSCKYEVIPCSGGGRGRDSFGNSLLIGKSNEPHEWFLVRVDAIVAIENLEEPELKLYFQLGMYRSPTKLTRTGDRLTEFIRKIPKNQQCNPWERTMVLMHELYAAFRYESGSTGFLTTAEEAFSQGCGVCQDYAHILLALCRREGLTARYVAGTIPGEGETHAWIEVWHEGRWKGFDPTNDRETDESYLTFAVGRDAEDCSLSRGVFIGAGNQNQYIRCEMTPI
ncbi:MAG: transglutaminase domain-containing protein [Oliverpabstia sp.]